MYYYTRHIGDYTRDTAHLTLLEHGVYARLLDVYYMREEGIPAANPYRVIGARTDEERRAVDDVLTEFFTPSEDGTLWLQKRCEDEIQKYARKADTNRGNGHLGGRPKGSKNPPKTQTVSDEEPNGNPTETQTVFESAENGGFRKPNGNPQETLTVNRKPIDPPYPPRGSAGVHGFPPGFDRFWDAYPRRVAKQDAAKAFAKVRADEALIEQILAALERAKHSRAWLKEGGRYIPNPATWLNGKRWLDEEGGDFGGGFSADPNLEGAI